MSDDVELGNDFTGVLGEEYSLLRHAYPHHDEFQAAVSRVLANHFRGSKVAEFKVLEGGVGSGVSTSFLLKADSRIRVTGVDNSLVMLKQMPELLGEEAVRVKPVLSDLLDYVWNCPDDSFDAFVSVWTLHNLQPAYRDSLLVEIKRVLRPDGIIILGDKFAVSDEKEHKKQLAEQLGRFGKFKANKPLAQKWMAHNEVDDYTKITEQEQLAALGDLGFDMVCVSYREEMEAVISATATSRLLVLAPGDNREINLELVDGDFVATITPPAPEELPPVIAPGTEETDDEDDSLPQGGSQDLVPQDQGQGMVPHDHARSLASQDHIRGLELEVPTAMSVDEAISALSAEGPETDAVSEESEEPVRTFAEIIAELNALAEGPEPRNEGVILEEPPAPDAILGPRVPDAILGPAYEEVADELAYEGGETDKAPPLIVEPEVPEEVREVGPQVVLARGDAAEDVSAESIVDPSDEPAAEGGADEEERSMATVAAETREEIRRRRADAQAEKITDFEEFERVYGPFSS